MEQGLTNIFMIILTVFMFAIGLLQWSVMRLLNDMKERLSYFCDQNEKDHDEMKEEYRGVHTDMWNRIYHHKHSESGNVEITSK